MEQVLPETPLRQNEYKGESLGTQQICFHKIYRDKSKLPTPGHYTHKSAGSTSHTPVFTASLLLRAYP